MVSYEVSIGFVMIAVLLCVGSLNLTDIVHAQRAAAVLELVLHSASAAVHHLLRLGPGGNQPAALRPGRGRVRTGRRASMSNIRSMPVRAVLPRRIRQHDPDQRDHQHPVPGRLAVAVPIRAVHLDSGHHLVRAARSALLLFAFVWVRGTFPRYRYDQLMRLGWKVFLPFSLFWLVLTAGVLEVTGWLPK